MRKKVFFSLSLFAFIATITFFTLKPNPKKEAHLAFLQLKAEHFGNAEKLLKNLNSTDIPEKTLYRSYLEQMRGRFAASDQLLQAAYYEANKEANLELAAEINLLMASNAYQQRRDEQVEEYTQQAHHCGAPSSSLHFFQGLSCYLKKNYTEAISIWENLIPSECNEWQAHSEDHFFSPAWKQIHLAHALIEKGEIERGRQLLEIECQNPYQRFFPLANVFLALSYIKESHTYPLDQRLSFYNMARFYLDQSHLSENLWREKNCIIQHVEKEAQELLLAGSQNNEWQKCGFEFVRFLQDWWATDAIDRLADFIVGQISAKQLPAEPLHLCTAIHEAFNGTLFHTRMTEKMLEALAGSIKCSEHEKMFGLWTLVSALSPNALLQAKELATLSSEEIFETIRKDSPLLEHTQRSIAFWEKFNRSSAEKTFLSQALIANSKLYWHYETQEDKGFKLMEMALELSGPNPQIHQEIALFLTSLYEQAENSNMIHRLTLIYDAMEHFKMGRQERASIESLANHLADAEYLYTARNFPAANTHAGWVLKLDPQNDTARRLVGLCTFQLGEYSKALAHLKELPSLDEEALRALMLSQAFMAQEFEPHLCHTEDTPLIVKD